MTGKTTGPASGGLNVQVTGGGRTNHDWSPDQLNLNMLHQDSSLSSPMARDFNDE